MKTIYLAPLALLALGACHKAADTPAAQSSSAAPVTKAGLTLSDARLILPAVAGHPGAAYFAVANDSDKSVTLSAITIKDAGKAEMHITTSTGMEPIESIDVPSKGMTVFAPGGRHVMVSDIGAKLTAGATGEITLTFADGDKLSAPLSVTAAGGDDMAGMQH